MKVELIEIGSVRKTHGYAGEIKLSIFPEFEHDIENASFIFIGDKPSTALPYEILSIRGIDWIVALQGLTSKEQSANLRHKSIYLKASDVTQRESSSKHETDSFNRFVGFAVIDDTLGEIGQIEEVDESSLQALAHVGGMEKMHLVPLSADLIKGIDFTKKIVFMNLPEGLLDL